MYATAFTAYKRELLSLLLIAGILSVTENFSQMGAFIRFVMIAYGNIWVAYLLHRRVLFGESLPQTKEASKAPVPAKFILISFFLLFLPVLFGILVFYMTSRSFLPAVQSQLPSAFTAKATLGIVLAAMFFLWTLAILIVFSFWGLIFPSMAFGHEHSLGEIFQLGKPYRTFFLTRLTLYNGFIWLVLCAVLYLITRPIPPISFLTPTLSNSVHEFLSSLIMTMGGFYITAVTTTILSTTYQRALSDNPEFPTPRA